MIGNINYSATMINRITPLLLFIGLAFWSCEDANDTGNEVLTEDCAGVIGGNAVLDNCGVCDDNADNDCTHHTTAIAYWVGWVILFWMCNNICFNIR